MKKGLTIALLLIGFIGGVIYGASTHRPPISQKVTASPHTENPIDHYIAQYESNVIDDRTFTPYSEQTSPLPPPVAQDPPPQVPQQASPEMSEDAGTPIPGTGHNAISQFGQNVGSLLQALVREILRAVVRFFDQLISS